MEQPKVGDTVAFVDHTGNESEAEVAKVEDQIPGALMLKVADGGASRIVGPVYFDYGGGQGTWHFAKTTTKKANDAQSA